MDENTVQIRYQNDRYLNQNGKKRQSPCKECKNRFFDKNYCIVKLKCRKPVSYDITEYNDENFLDSMLSVKQSINQKESQAPTKFTSKTSRNAAAFEEKVVSEMGYSSMEELFYGLLERAIPIKYMHTEILRVTGLVVHTTWCANRLRKYNLWPKRNKNNGVK